MLKRIKQIALILGLTTTVSSCSIIIESQTSSLADNLASAILDNEDMMTVKDGAPAFLLMLDGLIKNSPESTSMLAAGAELNAAYAGAFVVDEERKKLMLDKAKRYGEKALCLTEERLCTVEKTSLQEIDEILQDLNEEGLARSYTYASTWVSWLQANSSDWLAISQLPKIKAIFSHIVLTQPSYKDGAVYMYLGGMETLIPPALGGKPEKGKAMFEKANELSEGKNLMAKVLLAEKYARMVFDQELHDSVLQQVLSAEVKVPGYTLMNVMAQQKAKLLLAESPEYF